MGYEQQQICDLATWIGQRRPDIDTQTIAKTAAKLYRISSTIHKRGVVAELADHAESLAADIRGDYDVIIGAKTFDCFLQLDNDVRKIL